LYILQLHAILSTGTCSGYKPVPRGRFFVTTAERTQLGIEVVAADWETFKTNVADKWGTVEPYVIRELEDAVQEFLDEDPYAPVEERVQCVAAATERSQSNRREKETMTRARGQPRTVVWTSISNQLKRDLTEFADDNDLTQWEALTAAVREYNSGGRAQRCLDMLTEETVVEVEATLGDHHTEATKGPGHTEKVTRAIAQQLGPQFTEAELAAAIDSETSGSEYFHDRYRPRVIERKGVRKWERGSGADTFVPLETWMTRAATETLTNLGATLPYFSGPLESPPSPFTKDEFAEAAATAGVEVSADNREVVDELRTLVLDRIGYEWDDMDGHFAPGTGETSAPEDPS
jgi:RPA family protein